MELEGILIFRFQLRLNLR